MVEAESPGSPYEGSGTEYDEESKGGDEDESEQPLSPDSPAESPGLRKMKNNESTDQQPAQAANDSTGTGSREHVWKTAEGAEKRLLLPIETIQEDQEDDPDRLNSAAQGSKRSSQQKQSAHSARSRQPSAKSAARSKRGASASARGASPESPEIKVNRSGSQPTISAQAASGDAVNVSATLEESPAQDKQLTGSPARRQLTQKQRFPNKKKKGKAFKKLRSEVEEAKEESKVAVTGGEEGAVEEAGEKQEEDGEYKESVPLDPADVFERIKQKFFHMETTLNDEEQLAELKAIEEEKQKKEAAERERLAKEAEEKKKQDEEDALQKRIYGPGGRFGRTPALEAVQKALAAQAEARREKRRKEKAERKEQLRLEKLERGEKVDEEDFEQEDEESEEVDYTVVMQEEETVPEGQEDQQEKERVMEGRPMKQIAKYPGKLVKLKADSTLPRKLPDNLVYWNRCETRVDSSKIISYSRLSAFQKAELIQFEDVESAKKVMTNFPLIDDLEMWADLAQQKYVNQHEKAIHSMREWPLAQKAFVTEGFIKFERARANDCFFNSRFESGNLRQVFRVPQESDFDWVPQPEAVPDYLPDDLQEERRQEIQKAQQAAMQERLDAWLAEEKEEEAELKLLPHMRVKKEEPSAADRKKQEAKEKKETKDKEKADEPANADLEEVVGSDKDENEDQKESEDEEEDEEKRKSKKKRRRAKATPACEYNLYLQDDTNADSALFQWYYFSVMNVRADTLIRLNICNLSKPNGLYAKGMKPFVYSTNKQKATGLGWHRGGESVSYFVNGHQARYSKKTLDAHWVGDGSDPVGKDSFKKLHSLQFDYRFESDYDIVYFAHFQPYTYKDLVNYLCTLHADEANKDKMRLDHVCNSLGRAPMYGLTITNNIQTGYVNQGKEIFKFQRAEYKGAKVKHKKVKYLEAPPGEGDGDELVESDSHESASSARSRGSGSPDSPPRPTLDADSPEPGAVSRPGSAGAREPAKADGLDLRVMAVVVEDEEGNKAQVVSPKAVAPTAPPGISIAAMDVNKEETKEENKEENTEENKEENKEEEKSGADEAKEKEGDSSAADGTNQLDVPGKKRKKTEKVKAGMNETHHSAASGRRRGFGPKKKQEKDENEGKPEKLYKKHLFITSRVHPGESQASHMVHGLIDFLLSDHPEAEEIRDKFVVKVIPMLNPDGVIHGNYRVSVLGVDLNRRWKKPSKFLHPTIYYTKSLIRYFNEKSRQPGCEAGGVVLCCDMHGHSRNMDLFMYSCIDELSLHNMIIRAPPVGVDRKIPIFNLKNCKFALERDKENTARVVIYKDLGILCSYTLESTFFGSEFFKRPKHGSLLAKEEQDYQSERYGVSFGRKDIQVDHGACLLMGADFMRGVNYASKKRPLLPYWFRKPPENIVELFKPVKHAGGERDDDIDPVLLELEKAWRPIGHVDQSKHLGIGDRFDEDALPVQPPTPDEEKRKKKRKADALDMAAIDKQRRKKKEEAKKRKDAKKAEKGDAEKEGNINSDMADVLYSGKRGKKGKKKSKQPPTRNSASSKALDKKTLSQRNQSQASIEISQQQKTSTEEVPEPESPGRKVPILLRKPGASIDQDFDSDEDPEPEEDLRVSQLVFSKSKGLQLSNQLKQNASAEELQRRSAGTTSDDGADDEYLVSKALGSNASRESSSNAKPIGSLNATGDAFSKTKRSSKVAESPRRIPGSPRRSDATSNSAKRQLNLSVRVNEGKALFKAAQQIDNDATLAMPRISQLEAEKETSEDRGIESRLISDQRLPAHNPDNILDKSHYRHPEQESQAVQKLNEVAENDLRKEQEMLERLELTKKNLTQQVSADELDELMKTDADQTNLQKLVVPPSPVFTMAPQVVSTFRKNRLSVDPLVFPSSKLEALAQVEMATLEKELPQGQFSSFKSPRKSKVSSGAKSPSKGFFDKGVFAPQNAVYNQAQLLQHPELARQHGINFYVPNQDLVVSEQIQALRQQRSRKMINSKLRAGQTISPSGSQAKMHFAQGADGNHTFSPDLQKKSSRVFQQKLSTAALLQHSMSHQSSLQTIQTAVASNHFDQGFSINDYVNEQISLIEKTKVQVAAKKKTKSKVASPNRNLQGHHLVLPNITGRKKVNVTARLRGSSNSKKDILLELASVHTVTNGSHSQPTSEHTRHQPHQQPRVMENLVDPDDHLVELPALSPRAVNMPGLQRRCLEIKNGFDFANNVEDRHEEKLADLKQTSTLRERQRRLSKPQFVIKPLDPREFLNIQMQHVEDQSPDVKRSKRANRTSLHRPQKLENIRVHDQFNQPDFHTAHSRSPPLLSPARSRRTLSMGNPATMMNVAAASSLAHKSPESLSMTIHASPPPQMARATLRKEIKQREVKSLAVRNMVNQTIIVNNKLLVFKPN